MVEIQVLVYDINLSFGIRYKYKFWISDINLGFLFTDQNLDLYHIQNPRFISFAKTQIYIEYRNVDLYNIPKL